MASLLCSLVVQTRLIRLLDKFDQALTAAFIRKPGNQETKGFMVSWFPYLQSRATAFARPLFSPGHFHEPGQPSTPNHQGRKGRALQG
jgi:hypothetical protein